MNKLTHALGIVGIIAASTFAAWEASAKELIISGQSYHYIGDNSEFNNRNYGAFVRLGDDERHMIGGFKNSYGDISAAYTYSFYQADLTQNIEVSAFVGAASNYDEISSLPGGVAPTAGLNVQVNDTINVTANPGVVTVSVTVVQW